MPKSPESHELNENKRENIVTLNSIIGGANYGTVEEIKTKDPNVFGKLVESKIPFSEGDTILRHEEAGYDEGTTAGVYSLLRKGETLWTEFYTTSEYS